MKTPATLLDNDLYKFTMMQAVWRQQPDATVRYEFINRSPEMTFNAACVDAVRDNIRALAELTLTGEELAYLRGLPFMQEAFVDFLNGFRLREDQVAVEMDDGGALKLAVEGGWVDTILWEVPLLAAISEAYFECVDRDWDHDLDVYFEHTLSKARKLTREACPFIEFGTRRRRNYATQEAVIRAFNETEVECVGTSNVHFAMKYGMKPVGTMAHEWIMGYAGLGGVETANREAMRAWRDVYGDQLSVALTDTYTTGLFLENIRGELARAYHALRHDSESPFAFTDKVLAFYEREGIDPRDKAIVYSDSLDPDRAVEIKRYVDGRIPISFGIGTDFTNDFEGSRALNIVIKLFAINDRPVAKISDNPEKASGPQEAIDAAMAAVKRRLEPEPR